MDSMDDVRGLDIDIDSLIKEDSASFNFIFRVLKFVGIHRGAQGILKVFSRMILSYCILFVSIQFADLLINTNLDNRADSGKFFAACLSALTQFVVFHVKCDKMWQFQALAIRTNTFMLHNYKYFYELNDPVKPFRRTQRAIWSSYKKWYIGILITYLFVFIFSNFPVIEENLNDETGCFGRQTNSVWRFLDCRNQLNFLFIFISQDLLCGVIFLHVLWGFAAFRINVIMNMITQIGFLHNFIEKIGVRKKPIDSRFDTTDRTDKSSAKSLKKSLLQPLTKKAINRQLDICIRFHNCIQREQDILNEIFGDEVLMEFGCFTFQNCLTVFQAFSEREVYRLVTLFIFLCFGIGYLYSICEMGSALRFQCNHLTRAAYQCKWCTFMVPERRTVAMIIHKAQRTRYLRGAKVFDISVQTFVQLLRMSYSLLLFLFNIKSTNRLQS